MTIYLFRRGNGNDGNFPRFFVKLTDDQCPYAALAALCVSERIPGSRTRRYIQREIETDGDREYGIRACISDGPNGETDFGATWLTAELEPYTAEEFERSPGLFPQTLRDSLDRYARKFYRAQTKGVKS